jgi:hypothetical protein
MSRYSISRTSSPRFRNCRLHLEALEERALPSVQPITFADPSLYGGSIHTALEGGSLSSITPDGRYVAFTNYDYNPKPGFCDLDPAIKTTGFGWNNVFVRDRQTGGIQVVSVMPDGTHTDPEGGNSFNGQLSANGRYVAFTSGAPSLDANVQGTSGYVYTYVRDLAAGVTHMISVDPTAKAAGYDPTSKAEQEIAMSADGHYVAFTSYASNLVAGLSNTHEAVYVRDTVTNTTKLASINLAGTGSGNKDAYDISLSADGRYLVYVSQASDLAPNVTNGTYNIYVRDLQLNTTTLVSVNHSGTGPGNGESAGTNGYITPLKPAFTPDGRYVAFISTATNLTADKITSGTTNVFVRDLQQKTTTLVTINSTSTGSGNGSTMFEPVISADGRYVAFDSPSTNLVKAITTTNQQNVFVRDLQAKTTTLVSLNATGAGKGGNNLSGDSGAEGVDSNGLGGNRIAISTDGRFVAFRSAATNLLPNFVDGSKGMNENLFVRDVQKGTTQLINVSDTGKGSSNGYQDPASAGMFSADDSTLIFNSLSSDLVPNDSNNLNDVFTATIAGAGQVKSAAVTLPPNASSEISTIGQPIINTSALVTTSAVAAIPTHHAASAPSDTEMSRLYPKSQSLVATQSLTPRVAAVDALFGAWDAP